MIYNSEKRRNILVKRRAKTKKKLNNDESDMQRFRLVAMKILCREKRDVHGNYTLCISHVQHVGQKLLYVEILTH